MFSRSVKKPLEVAKRVFRGEVTPFGLRSLPSMTRYCPWYDRSIEPGTSSPRTQRGRQEVWPGGPAEAVPAVDPDRDPIQDSGCLAESTGLSPRTRCPSD